jgi:hypothetical protein
MAQLLLRIRKKCAEVHSNPASVLTFSHPMCAQIACIRWDFEECHTKQGLVLLFYSGSTQIRILMYDLSGTRMEVLETGVPAVVIFRTRIIR